MTWRRLVVILGAMALFCVSWTPAAVRAASRSQQAPCEPWQMPDGMGGCVDRCPPDQQWNNGECQPRPCPADRIDLNGNGQDNGDCEPLDMVNVPRPIPTNCEPIGNYGTVRCGLQPPFENLAVLGSPGCLRIDRNYFPRAIVNRQVTFQINGVIPSDDLPSSASDEGFYRTIAGDPYTVWGRTLGEEAQGTLRFDVGSYLSDVMSDGHPYPNIDNVTGYLELQRTPRTEWNVEGGSGSTAIGNSQGDTLRVTFRQSSFPGPGTTMASDGPNADNSANELPAYRLSVQSAWTLTYVVSYDMYNVSANTYTFAGRVVGARVPLLGANNPRRSWRVLGGKQGGVLQNTDGLSYCVSNVLDGYVPVPVIEMQSVLR